MDTVSKAKHGCLTSCSGLHADVERVDETVINSYKETTSTSLEKIAEVFQAGEYIHKNKEYIIDHNFPVVYQKK